MPAYAARDELQVDSGEPGPGGPDSGVVPAMFDVRLAVCCHEVIIETAAPSRKRIACIACMRQTNGGPNAGVASCDRSRGWQPCDAFAKTGCCAGGKAYFRVVLLDTFV